MLGARSRQHYVYLCFTYKLGYNTCVQVVHDSVRLKSGNPPCQKEETKEDREKIKERWR